MAIFNYKAEIKLYINEKNVKQQPTLMTYQAMKSLKKLHLLKLSWLVIWQMQKGKEGNITLKDVRSIKSKI